jgi:hypothetical protein
MDLFEKEQLRRLTHFYVGIVVLAALFAVVMTILRYIS